MNPTRELYQALEEAYNHFNESLFDGQLPNVIFTFQRKRGIMGFFSPDRWRNAEGGMCNEISINPSFLASSRLIEICQTLVHEMVHCWQFQFGKPSRNGYHNIQWARKMTSIGLMPSSTGEPGGEVTGQAMGDYIIEGGQFIKSYETLRKTVDFTFPWFDCRALPRLYEPVIAAIPNAVNEGKKSEVNKDFQIEDLDSGSIFDLSLEVKETDSIQSVNNYFNTDIESQRLTELDPSHFIPPDKPKSLSKAKYVCEGCGAKVYGKAGLNISCADCDMPFIEPN